MKVSLNVVKNLVNFELPAVDDLVARINAQLGGVEEIIDLGAKYGDARIVRVVECEKHPNADKLSVCKIDDGGAAADVPRDENNLVQVVCGAPNAHADMWAIWLPPKSTVPASFDDTEPFVLDARPLRGVLSQGMLAAADELAIGSDHAGIIEITQDDLRSGELEAGASFAEIFGLDDFVIDIENKMFTHRPDCFGQIGVAREIAGIFGEQFTSPEWYKNLPKFAKSDKLPLTVSNDAPENVPRFMAVALENIEIKPSPLWLQCALVAMGSKPINNVVDATNYAMLMTAQPTHAYDYDKLRGHKIGARTAENGERVTLLNGKTYELNNEDIVIVDGEGAIQLGGAMGGLESEVSDKTTRIVLECATFDMYALRKTAMRHGIFTDALTRFNKGQSPLQNDRILAWLMTMVGGEQASDVADEMSDAVRQALPAQEIFAPLTIAPKFIRERLGVDISKSEMAKMLGNVEFPMNQNNEKAEDDNLHISAPFWRTDIEQPEDVVEEIGRLYGFDKLPRELPTRSIKPAPKNSRRELKQMIRDSLSRAGANEVLTYSFVHERMLKNSDQNPQHAYKLSNALSPDLQYYRVDVLPSLLDKVHGNIKSGYDEFMLFEIGKTHDKNLPIGDDDLPQERSFVDAVYASKKSKTGAPFYRARRAAERLFDELGLSVKMAKTEPNDDEKDLPTAFDLQRSAWLVCGNVRIGVVGELKQNVRRNFKLPDYTAAFSIDFDLLAQQKYGAQKYQRLSRFPSMSQDISLKSTSDVSYDELRKVVESCANDSTGKVFVKIEPQYVYRAAADSAEKTTTFHLTMSSYDHTLTDKDVKPIMDHIASAALSTLGVERV